MEEADDGTLFLDEIGGLALPLQAKLLRVIETGEFRPIGARADKRSKFRTVAATNEPIDVLVASGRFRRDLAHRLAGIVIDVPPLRDRIEDIPALAQHFIRNAAAGRRSSSLSIGAIQALQNHDWPGNVRELRHVVERAVALSGGRMLRRQDILLSLSSGVLVASAHNGGRGQSRERSARKQLLDTLKDCGWDTARAAARLGVHRATLYRRMRRFGITKPLLAGAARSSGDLRDRE